ATALRFAVLREDGARATGTASISLAEAPASPRRRADLTNTLTMTPSSKARAALTRGLSLTTLARADNNAFDRAAMAASRLIDRMPTPRNGSGFPSGDWMFGSLLPPRRGLDARQTYLPFS